MSLLCPSPNTAYFYPRSPCGERPFSMYGALPAKIFLSTLSLRRATHRTVNIQRPAAFLSTLSLRRATGGGISHLIPSKDFYPRSPCGERRSRLPRNEKHRNFYPRSPCGERPRKDQRSGAGISISIHALLAESDLAGPSGPAFLYNFYPRSPCGERRGSPPPCERPTTYFYPRSPCGERLHLFASSGVDFAISIHALLAESDR